MILGAAGTDERPELLPADDKPVTVTDATF